MELTNQAARTATCAFLGDVRLNDMHTCALLDAAVQAYLDGHDIRCCNFEGAAFHPNAVSHKKAGPAVLQGKRTAERVLQSNCNLVTLANNHVMDYGERGLAATLDALSSVTTVGAGMSRSPAYRPYITAVNGVKLGFLALSEYQYGTLGVTEDSDAAGVAWINDPTVFGIIRSLRTEVNHIVLLCHAGLEDVEQPLPEWRALYRRFIDAGVSAVIASHPHIVQGWEQYKDGVIVYSLGNAAWEPENDFSERTSLLASVTFPLHGAPTLCMRPVEWRQGQIRFDERAETAARLDGIHHILHDEKLYRAEAERICRAFYRDIALQDFFPVTGALPGGKWQQLKNAVKLLVRKPRLNEPLLLSMLENESYRWAAAAGLRAAQPK